MKKISLLIALACATLHAQEWNGTVFPSGNDQQLDSLRKTNKILNDSRTGAFNLNVTSLLSPVLQVVANGEWNGTVFPSQNDKEAASMRKINKILNDARTGSFPLQITGAGGSGIGTVTSVSGTAGQITVVNPTTTPVISLPNALVFTGAATLKAQTWKLIGQTNYPTLITALDTTGYVALGDVDTAHNGTNIEISDQFSSINIKAGTSILLNGPVTANSITVSGATALAAVSASGAVTGAGFTARFASPGPIGNTSASTIAATTLSASSTVSGTGFVNRFSTPGPIGDGTPSTGAFTTLSATSVPTGAGFTALRTGALGITIDGGGSVITSGLKGYLYCPYACTLTAATVLADVSGSITIEIWKDTYANYPPVVGDKISASAPLTLSSAIKSQDTSFSGWTTVSVAAGDVLAFNVTGTPATVTRVHAVLTTLK